MIESPRNARVKQVRRLANKSERMESGLFLLEGPQTVYEALNYRPELVEEVFITPTALEQHPGTGELIRKAGLEPVFVSEEVIEALADTRTPQGVVAVCRQFPVSIRSLLREGAQLVAILEEVRDPGNAGTIIRAADAAGADAVILSGRSVDLYNPKLVRSTTGSIFHVPIAVGIAFDTALDAVREAGLTVRAADVKGRDLTELDPDELAEPTAWVFGNEARGLTDEALAACKDAVRVPIYGAAESLNLASAASICLYQTALVQRKNAR